MKSGRTFVTDHAVIRYLERVYGVNVDGLRQRIRKTTEGARNSGASAIKVDGVKYVLGDEGAVVSVDGGNAPMSKRGLRWKKRHK